MLTLCALVGLAGCGEGGVGGAPIDFAQVFEPDEAVIEEWPDATVLRMEGVEFTSRQSATLTSASLDVLDKFATVFVALPGARYTIESHTDKAGSSVENQNLTESRAAAVRDYLVDVVGGAPDAFSAVGYGESLPIDPGNSAAAFALNDRIEIIIEDD